MNSASVGVLTLLFLSSISLAGESSKPKGTCGSKLPQGVSAHQKNSEMPDAKLGQLKEAFNSSSDQVRMVSVLSPTCPFCQKGHRAIQSIFSEIQSDKLKGFLVWLPMLGMDDSRMAAAQSNGLHDSRILFEEWDGEKVIGKQFEATLGLTVPAWDVYLVYGPGVKWIGNHPPAPTFWMHQLRKDEGADPRQCLNVNRLKSEIKKLL